jgi:hypothetical protein
MRAIKTTIISSLTVGLLAGTAFGVTAQDEAASEEVMFGIVGFLDEGEGWHTAIGEIPAGHWTADPDESIFEPPATSNVLRFDPGEPGGDTFDISLGGVIRGTFEPEDIIHGTEFWSVVPNSGTGEYAGLSGKGQATFIAYRDGGWRTDTLVGTLTMPADGE